MNEYAAGKLKRAFENARIFQAEIQNLETRIVEYNFYLRDPNTQYDKASLQANIDQMRGQIERMHESVKNEEMVVNNIMNDPALN